MGIRCDGKNQCGQIEVDNKPIICLFDTASEGDVISYDLYHSRFRRTPLEKVNTYIHGIDKNSRTEIERRITLRVVIGHRKVKMPFLVVRNVTNNMIIGFPSQTALVINTITTENILRVTTLQRPSTGTLKTSPIPMIDPRVATAPRAAKLRAAEDLVIAQHVNELISCYC